MARYKTKASKEGFVVGKVNNRDEMLEKILAYIRARDWEQFHNPKDVAISLALEASEVLEHFQWKTPEEIKQHLKENLDDVAEELADVLYWVLLMAHYLKIDLNQAVSKKMLKNEKKYPVKKARGSHKKYTHYQNKDV
jgi:NTP pyrophosphatase (non-canonical NTP hydrolase)